MTIFKTLDIRGLSFFNGFDMATKAFNDIKRNGVLEIILDKKKNFTEAFKNWANSQGYGFSDIDDDTRMVRVFIRKDVRKTKK